MYRSEVIKQNLNPDWKPFELSTSAVGSIGINFVCGTTVFDFTTLDTFFTINCYDWDKDGSHDLIGTISTTLREFTFGSVQIALVDPEHQGRQDVFIVQF